MIGDLIVCASRNGTEGKIHELYEKRARQYEKIYIQRLGWGKTLREYFLSAHDLQPSIKILDAGCGTGIITRTLLKIAQEKMYQDVVFHAFDLSQEMLNVFQEYLAHLESTNVKLSQTDVLKLGSLPAGWNNYDLIVSSGLLEYIPVEKVHTALCSLKQLLKPGGVLLLLITRRTFLSGLIGKLWWRTNLFDEKQVEKILLDAGAAQVKFKKLPNLWSSYVMVVEAR